MAKRSPLQGFRPGLRVLVTVGDFAGTEGRIIGHEEAESFDLIDPEDRFWVIVPFRDGETAVMLRSDEMRSLGSILGPSDADE